MQGFPSVLSTPDIHHSSQALALYPFDLRQGARRRTGTERLATRSARLLELTRRRDCAYMMGNVID